MENLMLNLTQPDPQLDDILASHDHYPDPQHLRKLVAEAESSVSSANRDHWIEELTRTCTFNPDLLIQLSGPGMQGWPKNTSCTGATHHSNLAARPGVNPPPATPDIMILEIGYCREGFGAHKMAE
jgi:hypothetical protein